jgi:hypothetical protein
MMHMHHIQLLPARLGDVLTSNICADIGRQNANAPQN